MLENFRANVLKPGLKLTWTRNLIALSRNPDAIKKKLFENLSVDKGAYPKFRYSSKHFAPIYRAQYEAMLVYLRVTPTWRAEDSVNK